MARSFILFAMSFFFLLNPTKPLLEDLFFDGFNDVGTNMSFNGGAAVQETGVLRMTSEMTRVLGRAFYSSPVRFKDSANGKVFSFSTAFAFAIVPEYATLGGHGFAFTISPSMELPGALPSQYLGLLNASNVGNPSNHIFAVEFDTVQDFEFDDINDNHIGIDLNNLVSNKSVPAFYFAENGTRKDLILKSGEVIQAWIDYDSSKQLLEVKLSVSSDKPNSSILSYGVDLSPILLDNMYIGFSAATGLLSSWHYILGWSFKMNGEATSLYLDTLPSLPGLRKSNTSLVVGVSLLVALFLFVAVAIATCIFRKIWDADDVEAWELEFGPHRFPYRELKQATRGFKDQHLLGFGGFGRVYKGTLPISNSQVAVKRISRESKQGLQEFLSEIGTIGRLSHRNLVQLLGWCRKHGDLLLVYDYMPNGSLDKYIFDEPRAILSWEQRFKIIKGVASGLLYLHEEWEQTVLHRDIKAANVLLDSELNGRLGDFGLAKLYEHGSNPSTTRVVGTLGYLAPELTRTGKPTKSSDVFAFGALLLEVACGRRPIEPKALPEELILVDWVWDRWRIGAMLDVVDSRLRGEFDEVEAIVVLKLGLMCSNNLAEYRPNMRQIVSYLEGEVALPDAVPAPDSFEDKKSGNGVYDTGEFEDYVHSYSSSSNLEKASTHSFNEDSGNADIETGCGSLSSFAG